MLDARARRGPAPWPPCSAWTPTEVEAGLQRGVRAGRRGGGRQPQRARPDRHLRRSRSRSPARARAARPAGAKRVIPLKVSGAFHSPLMAPAVDGLHDALAGVDVRRPGVPGHRQRQRRGGAHAGRTRSGCWPISSPRRFAGSSACRRAAALVPGARLRRGRAGQRAGGLLKRIVPGARRSTLGTGGRGGDVPRSERTIDLDRQDRVRHRQHPGHRARHRAGAARRRRQGGRRRPRPRPGRGGGRGARRAGRGGRAATSPMRPRSRRPSPRRSGRSARSTSWSTTPGSPATTSCSGSATPTGTRCWTPTSRARSTPRAP